MSRKPYECFRCRDNGFPGTQVYLAGKDHQNKTIYVEDDGTTHVHRTKPSPAVEPRQPLPRHEQVEVPTAAGLTSLRIIDAKLDRVINILTSAGLSTGEDELT